MFLYRMKNAMLKNVKTREKLLNDEFNFKRYLKVFFCLLWCFHAHFYINVLVIE